MFTRSAQPHAWQAVRWGVVTALLIALTAAGTISWANLESRTSRASAVPLRGAATCTDPAGATQWRVTWKRTDTSRNAMVTPTGFAVRVLAPTGKPTSTTSLPEVWRPSDTDTWGLHWNPTGAQVQNLMASQSLERVGPLTVLAAIPMVVAQSPRYTTPDGACTVFITPFSAGPPNGKTVAVVGDSLVAQLYPSLNGTGSSAGLLEQRLTAAGYRVEINGQSGRRWTGPTALDAPELTSLERADVSLFDEIRGLVDAQSLVIALGTNDAGWVALAPTEEQFQFRLRWTLKQLGTMLDELDHSGHCAVLLTIANRNKTYDSSVSGRFATAAAQIDDLLRQRAERSSEGRLKLWDWAATANPHGTADPDPWFGPDTIHLLSTGRLAYADAISRAAALC